MQIWLETNIQAHDFIPQEYWTGNFELVKDMLPQAEIYVHVNDTTHQIDGFIGLADEYIEGIFVQKDTQSHGVGRQLLEYAKQLKPRLSLHVYQENHRAVRFTNASNSRLNPRASTMPQAKANTSWYGSMNITRCLREHETTRPSIAWRESINIARRP